MDKSKYWADRAIVCLVRCKDNLVEANDYLKRSGEADIEFVIKKVKIKKSEVKNG